MSFDVGQLDDVVHGRLRLGVLAYLAANETADFNELKDVLKATQGNLSVHLRKLEEAGYVRIRKGFLGRKPRTTVDLTPRGRKAFATYLERMAALIDGARG